MENMIRKLRVDVGGAEESLSLDSEESRIESCFLEAKLGHGI